MNVRSVVMILVASGAAVVGLGLTTTSVPTAYTTGDYGERITSLELTPGEPQNKQVMFCIDLGSTPQGGEVLAATADVEVTNNLGYDVSFISHIVLGESCSAITGTEITEAQGGNITPLMHHGTANRAGTLLVPQGNSRRFVVMVVWAASTRAQSGDALKVEQDYGRLSVLRWGP